jgi:2,4-dienoyl-CoA reductase-like NADH-dependent reductase (Old Yellow Enzyme family)
MIGLPAVTPARHTASVMPTAPAFVRVPSLKTVEALRAHLTSLHVELPCDDTILTGSSSPLAQPLSDLLINGKRLKNRWVVQPMEGWDGSPAGGATEEVVRRWRRFGESGAGLVCGGEAMAVRLDGRANPNQLVLVEANQRDFAALREAVVRAHAERYPGTSEPVIGFQLTHSGRFCRPNDKRRFEPRVAFRHPLLDRRFQVTADSQVISDDDVCWLIEDYARAARLAWDVGADFVDIKHCHGYLLHEFLGAHTRAGRFGGSFENRTRILRDIVQAIRAECSRLELAVRLSAFDFVPYRPDPRQSQPGKPGPGIPEDYAHCLPYRYGFGVHPERPTEPDLTEPLQFVRLCSELGIRILNLSAGSPYYNPHIQRPAAYPPSDGYQPPEDPLVGVARQIQAVRQLKAAAPPGLALVGSAYSYLQDYLPHVAQAVLRQGWVDLVGVGRMILSYPAMLADAVTEGRLNPRWICRTFSDCTTAPRNGLVSGCYPLDDFYRARPEAAELKRIKASALTPT